MAHLIDFSNARANVAFVGETPWHGLGQKLNPSTPFDVWLKEAGLDWTANKARINFEDEDGTVHRGESEIIYRSDTKKQLGVVSDRYKIVQPREVIEFYSDLVGTQGWDIEVAGSLDEGKRIWALAKTDASINVLGTQDSLETYLLLATAFDGTMATVGKFSSVRVVCQNTLTMSLHDGLAKVSVPHSRVFDANVVKRDLGIYVDATMELEANANRLAKQNISDKDAMRFIIDVLAGKDTIASEMSTRQSNIVRSVYDLYKGKGMGSNFQSANGTAWGLVNSVTEYVDHHVNSRNVNNRIRSAWFGQGESMKNIAFETALQIAA